MKVYIIEAVDPKLRRKRVAGVLKTFRHGDYTKANKAYDIYSKRRYSTKLAGFRQRNTGGKWRGRTLLKLRPKAQYQKRKIGHD